MSRMIPLLVATALLFLIDLYAFQAIRSVMHNSNISWRRIITIIYWSISIICIGFIWYATFFGYYSVPKLLRVYLTGALVVFYIPKLFLIVFLLIDDLIRGGKWLTTFFTTSTKNAVTENSQKGISRSQFLTQTGLVVSGFFLFQFVYGIVRTAYNYQLRRVKIAVRNLPAEFEGLKIVQVSDIHSGSFTRKDPLVAAVKMINEENPDLIFFTGDLVNNESTEALEYIDVFGKMKAKHGVYSIFGNHDYGDYMSWDSPKAKADNLKLLEDIHARMGWKLLRNQNVLLGNEENQLAIIGVENWSNTGRFQTYGDLKKALEGTENAKTKLLLSHDPSHWNGEVTKSYNDIDVTFSGHTHGFQFGVEIPGFKWSPAKFIYKQWAGLYQQAHQSLYINRGLGFLAYNGRVGIPPEITVIQLVKS
ncbi:MAG: metallophosphoesterase [Chitinophagales bacterium]|nr:metallophosphoesterase [Chitinophagales bacterium]